MGLFNLFSGPKTKADWDKEIIYLNNKLASAKSYLAKTESYDPKHYDKANIVAFAKKDVAKVEAELANAKIKRENAPK